MWVAMDGTNLRSQCFRCSRVSAPGANGEIGAAARSKCEERSLVGAQRRCASVGTRGSAVFLRSQRFCRNTHGALECAATNSNSLRAGGGVVAGAEIP